MFCRRYRRESNATGAPGGANRRRLGPETHGTPAGDQASTSRRPSGGPNGYGRPAAGGAGRGCNTPTGHRGNTRRLPAGAHTHAAAFLRPAEPEKEGPAAARPPGRAGNGPGGVAGGPGAEGRPGGGHSPTPGRERPGRGRHAAQRPTKRGAHQKRAGMCAR